MSEIPRRRRIPTLVATAVAALLVAPAPAAAASCGRAVLEDWSDGRIDKQYPLHCYDEAIELLPRDLSDYSRAEEDILRALQSARRGQAAPPNRDGGANPEEPPPAAPPTATTPETPTTGVTETTAAPPLEGPDDPGTEAAPPVEDGSPSSVPIPLLVLAGIALLLVAGGSAGYVLRRVQARRLPPTA